MSVVMSDRTTRQRITVDEYYRMAEEGILQPDARVELIEGEIIDMPPMGSEHGGAVGQLADVLYEAVRSHAHLRTQLPVHLSDISEPVPDFALVKFRGDYYRKRHPRPEDTFLAIEVSYTSVRYDTQVKASLYARYGIPEYWVVDLEGRQVRFFRSPRSDQYAEVTSTATPAVVVPIALPDVKIDLSHLFGG
jgi:Uma2 family endonuclease